MCLKDFGNCACLWFAVTNYNKMSANTKNNNNNKRHLHPRPRFKFTWGEPSGAGLTSPPMRTDELRSADTSSASSGVGQGLKCAEAALKHRQWRGEKMQDMSQTSAHSHKQWPQPGILKFSRWSSDWPRWRSQRPLRHGQVCGQPGSSFIKIIYLPTLNNSIYHLAAF